MSGLHVPTWLELIIKYWPIALVVLTGGIAWVVWVIAKFFMRHWH